MPTNYSELMEKKIDEMRNNLYKIQRYQDALTTLYQYRASTEEHKVDENGSTMYDENGNYICLGRKSEDVDSWDAWMYDAWTIAIKALEKEIEKMIK